MSESKEQTRLKEQILAKLQELNDGLFDKAKTNGGRANWGKFLSRKTLAGHFQKVHAIDWGGNSSDLFLSASQDGKLIVWNALTTNKLNAITLEDNWVMTCCFEKHTNALIATGGLKNICYIYRQAEYQPGQQLRPMARLEGHEGYISSCHFIGENQVVTSSGDKTCRLWDVTKNAATAMFKGHTKDVMSISVHPDNKNIFVTGSNDLYCKLWDIRENKNVAALISQPEEDVFRWEDEAVFEGDVYGAKMLYEGHESDVNAVQFLQNGFAFGAGSEDATCSLWDIRSHQRVNLFKNRNIINSINSIDFSLSGKVLFAGDQGSILTGWDTLKSPDADTMESENLFSKRDHEEAISDVKVHTGGKAVATGSWDSLIKIYA